MKQNSVTVTLYKAYRIYRTLLSQWISSFTFLRLTDTVTKLTELSTIQKDAMDGRSLHFNLTNDERICIVPYRVSAEISANSDKISTRAKIS